MLYPLTLYVHYALAFTPFHSLWLPSRCIFDEKSGVGFNSSKPLYSKAAFMPQCSRDLPNNIAKNQLERTKRCGVMNYPKLLRYQLIFMNCLVGYWRIARILTFYKHLYFGFENLSTLWCEMERKDEKMKREIIEGGIWDIKIKVICNKWCIVQKMFECNCVGK